MRNNGTLQEHYAKLAPRERLTLLLAAKERGDEQERCALIDAAPTALYRLPDYHNALDMLQLMALSYLINQLNRAWSMSTLAHVGEIESEAYRGARMGAYTFCVQADAWRAFCGELGIGENAMLAGFGECSPFEDALFSLEFTEKIAREFAFTFDEAQAEARRTFGADAGKPITVERALQDVRCLFDKHAAR
ncbi:MAG: hypothetical protein HY741_14090 [Chloroflexi bacterium]|nr:hypothetical protein [Chloroflexota bacterium]